jgi:hypothetical protein
MSRPPPRVSAIYSRAGAPAAPAQRGQPIAFFLALLLLAATSLYAALLVVQRIDEILFPGANFGLPKTLARLPGLDSGGDSALPADRINILVLGLDQRPHHAPDLDGPPRSDSIYIVSLDPHSRTGSVVAVPRDLYVEMPNPRGGSGYWDTRVNTAYHYGEYYRYPGGGAGLARATIEHVFKLKIHHHAVIDWTGFAAVWKRTTCAMATASRSRCAPAASRWIAPRRSPTPASATLRTATSAASAASSR